MATAATAAVSAWTRPLTIQDGLYDDSVAECLQKLVETAANDIARLRSPKLKLFLDFYVPSVYARVSQRLKPSPAISEDRFIVATRAALELGADGKPMNAIEMVRLNSMLSDLPNLVGARGELYDRMLRDSDPVAAGPWLYRGSPSMELCLQDQLALVEASFASAHPIAYACSLMMIIYSRHPFKQHNEQMAQLCFVYGLARHGISVPVIFSDGHEETAHHHEYAKRRALSYYCIVGSPSYLHTMGVMALHQLMNNIWEFL